MQFPRPLWIVPAAALALSAPLSAQQKPAAPAAKAPAAAAPADNKVFVYKSPT